MTTTATFRITTPARKNPFDITVTLEDNGQGRPWVAGGYMVAASLAAQRIYRLKRIGATRTTGTPSNSGYFIGNVANRHGSNVDHASYGEPFHVSRIDD